MVSSRIVAVGVIALVIGVLIGYAAPYAIPALQPPKPTIALSATAVKTGEQYNATLSGFPANTEIYGWTVNENPPRSFVAGTTDGNGKLVLTANAPTTPGKWVLCASDESQNSWATTILNVDA